MFTKNLNKFNSNKFFIILLFFVISLGVYLCFINKYGWDWDTYAMIETYLNILEDGKYLRSRGHGYIVPEIGIGFLSYFFGSFVANLTTFIFLITGLVFIYKSFAKISEGHIFIKNKYYNEKLIAFLIICLSNHIVLRDSTIPIDFSWSFIFYSLGFYFITRKQVELSVFFFSICIASRLNFIIFILPIFLFLDDSFFNNKKKLAVIFIIITFGGLFYLPSWLQSSFSLNFIFSSNWYNANKVNGIYSLIEVARFTYKTINTIGVLFLVSAGLAFILNKNKISSIIRNYKFPLILIFFNLILFFYFPWEPSYLWILIFSLNFIFVSIFSKKILFFLILINIFNWFYKFDIIQVKYINDPNNDCYREPIDAEFNFHFDKGILLSISERQKHAKCYPDIIGNNLKILNYKFQINEGIKLSN